MQYLFHNNDLNDKQSSLGITGIALNQETLAFSTLSDQQVSFTTATSYTPKAVFGIIFGAHSSNNIILNIVYTISGKKYNLVCI